MQADACLRPWQDQKITIYGSSQVPSFLPVLYKSSRFWIYYTMYIIILISVLCILVFKPVSSNPISFSAHHGHPQSVRRDIPVIPPRPNGVGPNSFHGSQFAFFDDIGFVAGSPGVEAAPVFLYSRTGPTVVSTFNSPLLRFQSTAMHRLTLRSIGPLLS